MAAPRKQQTPDTDEPSALLHIRRRAIAVVLTLIAITVVADTFGRLFINGAFHIDGVVLGTLGGILLTLFFGEAAGRVVKLSFGKDWEEEKEPPKPEEPKK